MKYFHIFICALILYSYIISKCSVATCVTLTNSSLCSTVISVPVRLANGTNCPKEHEQLLNPFIINFLPSLYSTLSTNECRLSVTKLFCTEIYSECSLPLNQTDLLPCKSHCDETISECSNNEIDIINKFLSIIGSNIIQQCSLSNQSQYVTNSSHVQCKQLPQNITSLSSNIITQQFQYPRCEQYTGSTCRGIVNYPVYVPSDMTIDLLESIAHQQLSWVFPLLPKFGKPQINSNSTNTIDSCLMSFEKYICSQIFLQCDNSVMMKSSANVSLSFPFPQLPFQSLCQQYDDSCSDVFIQMPQMIPNCSSNSQFKIGQITECDDSIVITPAQSDFPLTSSIFNSQLSLITQCNSMSHVTESIALAAVDCPMPLVKADANIKSTVAGGSCSGKLTPER